MLKEAKRHTQLYDLTKVIELKSPGNQSICPHNFSLRMVNKDLQRPSDIPLADLGFSYLSHNVCHK